MRALSPIRQPQSHVPRVIGLGASAGGLAALEAFFANVPADTGLAFVVVQHMDPTKASLLGSLLQRVTALPVHEVVEGMLVQANAVYVIPPACELTLSHGCLHLSQPAQERGLRLPINVLLSSLAREQGTRAVGVVLSGMGTDGTLGLQAVHSSGGLTLVQQPQSAQFDGMPTSAIATDCVDIVALPSEMPSRIMQVIAQTSRAGSPVADDDSSEDLARILGLLSQHSKHDLALYKSSTLMRRIERRVAVHRLASMAAYADMLEQNPIELDLLFAEMLIGVTRFFRDAEMWDDLATQVLPALMARHVPRATLRAWVVGCSTGEEAYSLAMLFVQAQDARPESERQTLQIFATDLSADALAVARKGWYPSRIASELSAEQLARFFVAEEGGWRVHKLIRDMVLFAQHDVILDPPFTRLDLLSCRNVLIYFNAVLQQRLMPLFHYSLCPGGVLVLGSSETVGRAQSLFGVIKGRTRLYQRLDHALGLSPAEFPINPMATSAKAAQEVLVSSTATPSNNLQNLADQVLLRQHAPAAVLVNHVGDILYINGSTGRYLEPAAGKANWNIHVMARPSIRTQLAVALRQAIAERKTVVLKHLPLGGDGSFTLDITIQCLAEPKALVGTAMIVFKEGAPRPRVSKKLAGSLPSADEAMQRELTHAREEILALRQEMQATHDELQAANEALQSTNEELQSANEELTTSKEEAQSMNEELQTINSELQSKLDDLAVAQSDMQNLLDSTDIATLFLDNDLNVRRFTERTKGLFQLRDGDIGRPLSDLSSKLVYPDLHLDAKETLRSLVATEREVPTTDARWLTVRVMPYRTVSNLIQGVVLTFVDITASKALEASFRKA